MTVFPYLDLNLWPNKILEHRFFLPVCFSIFLLSRLLLVAFIPVSPSADAEWYFSCGARLAETGLYYERGVPTAFWPVGYPAFLGGLFFITGKSILAAQLANLVFSGCSFWLLYKYVLATFRNNLAARLSVLLLTIYPNNAVYVQAVLTESLYTFLILGVCVLLLSDKKPIKLVLTSLILGLATLLKTQTIMLTPILITLSFLNRWSFRECIHAATYGVFGTALALLVVMPWTWRNYTVFGEFVLVSTNGGQALLAGNNDSVVNDYLHDYSLSDPLYLQAGYNGPFNQVQADKRARQLGKQWILNNPSKFIALIPKKFFRLWAIDGEGEWIYQAGTPWYDQHATWFRLVRYANQAYYYILLAVFSLSAWNLLRGGLSPHQCLGLAIIAFFTFLCMVFSGQSRYHFPAMPFIIAFVSYEIIQRITRPNAAHNNT